MKRLHRIAQTDAAMLVALVLILMLLLVEGIDSIAHLFPIPR